MRGKKKPKYYLFPVKEGVKPTHHSFLCMDTENDPDTGVFILAALYGYYQDHHGKEHLIEEVYHDRHQLMNRLKEIAKKGGKNINYRLGLFNAPYDIYFIRELVNDTTRITVGGRLITARLKCGGQKGIPIFDATNLVDGKLEKWMEDLNMEEKYGIKKLPLSQLEDRCLMDAKATYYLFKWLEDTFVYEFKIPLKYTIGSSALTLFQRHYLKQPLIRYNDFFNQYERKAYRGGRVEVFKRGKQEYLSFDVNSMYVGIMKDLDIPLPQSAKYHKDGSRFDLNKIKAAVVYCKVSIPKQIAAPLPYIDNNTHKLIFPYGIFKGYYTSMELKEAIKYGTKILEVYDYVEYTQLKPLFRDYAIKIWEKRLECKAAGLKPMDKMYKKLGNSLYGKFGEKHQQNDWIRISDFDADFNCDGALIRKDVDGTEYVYVSSKRGEDSTHTFPIIAVWITSAARIKLLRMIKKYEKDVTYVDTDSIKISTTSHEYPKDSKELGGWGIENEGKVKTDYFYRPKMYSNKHKGVPNNAKLIKEDEDGFEFEFRLPIKRSSSLRRGIVQNKWIKQIKRITKKDDKRDWISENESYPLYVCEED